MIYKIIDNIYLSNTIYASINKLINKNNINTIFRIHDKDEQIILSYTNDIKVYKIELEDNILYNISILKFGNIFYNYVINHPNENILITCKDGASCSVAIIIFYIITKFHYNLKNSLTIIKSIKINASINNGFINILNLYYYKLRDNNFIKTNKLLKTIIHNEKEKNKILIKD